MNGILLSPKWVFFKGSGRRGLSGVAGYTKERATGKFTENKVLLDITKWVYLTRRNKCRLRRACEYVGMIL